MNITTTTTTTTHDSKENNTDTIYDLRTTDSETFKTSGRHQLLWKHLELKVQKEISVSFAGTLVYLWVRIRQGPLHLW